jgi:transglutaminase-like putative cysteine protease
VSLFGLLVVVGLALGGLVVAGVLRLRLSDGSLTVGVARYEGPVGVRVDVREGLLSDACVVALVWLTATLVAGSGWVGGSEVLVPLSVTAAVVCLVLAKTAPRGTTYWLAVEVTAVLALFIFTANHTANPLLDFITWVKGVRGAVSNAALVTMAGAAWMAIGWSTFWVARKRNATIALVPLAVALAVEIINDPTQTTAGGITVFWILVAAVLLLRLHTARIRNRWQEMADSQVWIFISSRGALVVIALLVVAVLAPPLNTVDLSVSLFHGRDAGQGVGPGDGNGGPGPIPGSDLTVTGYSDHVAPGGTLTRSASVVMQVSSDFTRPVYWRGINLYSLSSGQWTRGSTARVSAEAPANTNLDTGSDGTRQVVHGTIEVLGVPQQTIFWPGDPVKADQATLVRSDLVGPGGGVATVEAAYAKSPLRPGTKYAVQAADSLATEDDLRHAGTTYPVDILRRTFLVAPGQPRVGSVTVEVTDLARQVAGTGTVYDQVKNIETYLRTQERYQLKINAPPPGADPVSYFLFTSHVGYCEYFASSMGEMVRSLGIPVRLVSGYGPGAPTAKADVGLNFLHEVDSGATVSTIRASDAHTWVEVYFPAYGWVPFEPTPDPAYPALARGAAAPVTAPATTAGQVVPPVAPPAAVPANQQGRVAVPAALGLGLAFVLIAALLVLLATRIARGPGGGNLGVAWSRLGWLGVRLGVTRRATDTPLEFSSRLAGRLPGLGDEIMTLGRAYSRSIYSSGSTPEATESEAAAWRTVRAQLVRLLALGPRGAGVSPAATAPQS